MEIERKYLLQELPDNLDSYDYQTIEQAYLCTDPVVRIRREDAHYYLTYKGHGLLAREEYNLPLTEQSYHHLLTKADGNIIRKKRILIPLNESALAELDIFEEPFDPLIMVEVEFTDLASADAFIPPSWFGEEVTHNPAYHNSNLSKRPFG